ncbi:MAG TPA: DUF6776 family protein [Steroidobacteraceae bacterium]|nr:DUF6776 family protein [Steroidobacteraceae bacterium]
MARLAALFSRDAGAPHVVRRGNPVLRGALITAGALIGIFAVYVVYELGRYDAGYDRQAVAQQRTEFEVKIEHLEKDNRELRTKLAEFDTIRLGRAREQAEVARTIGDLQAQVARQQQELGFYRGVVAQGAATLGVKIEDLRIAAVPGQPSAYRVHLALVRSGREGVSSGNLVMSVDGESGGTATTLDLATLTGGKLHELRYDFRYFQDVDEQLALPEGFRPAHLVVEVHSARKDVKPLTQTYLWNVETSP